MNEHTIKAILEANSLDEGIWRVADPASGVRLSQRDGFSYMSIPSNSTPFEERIMAGPVTWSLEQVPPVGDPFLSALILRFPTRDGRRLCPFLLELIEAAGTDALSSTVALEIAKEWEELWKKGADRLSKEQQRGLIAELIILRNLLAHRGSAALSMWKGPEGGLHDFEIDSCFIEVKSHGKLSKIISVSKLQQLEPLQDSLLQLCCVGLSRAESGTSLVELIEEIHSSLEDDLKSRFIDKLREVNYNPADSALYSSKYSIEEIRIGLVTDETMTLHRGKLKVPNPALKDVLYKLDSSLLNLDSVAIENPLVTILDQ